MLFMFVMFYMNIWKWYNKKNYFIFNMHSLPESRNNKKETAQKAIAVHQKTTEHEWERLKNCLFDLNSKKVAAFITPKEDDLKSGGFILVNYNIEINKYLPLTELFKNCPLQNLTENLVLTSSAMSS